jgi:hypothetical protein
MKIFEPKKFPLGDSLSDLYFACNQSFKTKQIQNFCLTKMFSSGPIESQNEPCLAVDCISSEYFIKNLNSTPMGAYYHNSNDINPKFQTKTDIPIYSILDNNNNRNYNNNDNNYPNSQQYPSKSQSYLIIYGESTLSEELFTKIRESAPEYAKLRRVYQHLPLTLKSREVQELEKTARRKKISLQFSNINHTLDMFHPTDSKDLDEFAQEFSLQCLGNINMNEKGHFKCAMIGCESKVVSQNYYLKDENSTRMCKLSKCGHVFCQDCLFKSVSSQLTTDKAKKSKTIIDTSILTVKCPIMDDPKVKDKDYKKPFEEFVTLTGLSVLGNTSCCSHQVSLLDLCNTFDEVHLNKLLLLLVTNYFDQYHELMSDHVGSKIALDNVGFKAQPNTSTSMHNKQNPYPNLFEQSSKLSQCPNPKCHFIEGFCQSFTSCSQCHHSFCSQCRVYDGLDAELHRIFPNCQIFKLIRILQTNLAKNSKR